MTTNSKVYLPIPDALVQALYAAAQAQGKDWVDYARAILAQAVRKERK